MAASSCGSFVVVCIEWDIAPILLTRWGSATKTTGPVSPFYSRRKTHTVRPASFRSRQPLSSESLNTRWLLRNSETFPSLIALHYYFPISSRYKLTKKLKLGLVSSRLLVRKIIVANPRTKERNEQPVILFIDCAQCERGNGKTREKIKWIRRFLFATPWVDFEVNSNQP